MATVEKDVLWVGTVQPPGLDKPLRFTREDLEHYRTRMRDMLKAGLQIPIAYEHQSHAKPMTAAEIEAMRAEQVKNTIGWVEDADLKSDGPLINKFEIPDEEDRKRLPKSRFVSPEISWGFRDGDGRLWPGPSITHIAVTPRPVQHHQQPFRLSVLESGEGTIRLSMADYKEKPMADDYEKPDDDLLDESDEEQPEEPTPAPEPTPEEPAKGEEKVQQVREVLARMGVVLPEDTTQKNFLERLHAAVLTAEHHMAEKERGEGGDEEEEEEPPMAEQPTEVQEQPPVGLSLEQRMSAMEQKVADAEAKRVAAEKRADANANHALKQHRLSLERRIDRCAKDGRCDKPAADKLKASLKTVKLSLTDDGELAHNDLLTRLEVYESLPKGAVFGPTERAQLSLDSERPTEVKPPRQPGEPLDESRVDEILDWMCGPAAK